MKCLWCLLLFLIATAFSYAQPAWSVFNTAQSGIPDNAVHCVTIDYLNRKWIGTDFGITVFNDTVFTVYQVSNSGLPDNHVREIFIDHNNVKWIGTQNGGLTMFNDTAWTTYNTGNSTLPDNQVKSVTEDTTGLLWIGTTGGLVTFNGSKFTTYSMFSSLLMSNNIPDIFVGGDNTKLICTLNGGLSLASDTVFATYTINNSGFPDNSILQVDEDTAGVFWFVSPAGGLIAYLGGTNWLVYNISNSGLTTNSLTGIDCWQNGTWITTTGGGLIYKQGLNFNTFTTINSLLPDNYTNCVTVDNNGTVWIGTASAGLVKLSPALLSLNEIIPQKKLKLFPNPSTGFIFVNTEGEKISSIKIIHVDGREMKCRVASIHQLLKFDVRDFNTGLYFIKMQSENGMDYCNTFLIK